ncbi:MAG: hypothetical protein K8Q99_01780 [Acholeplasmataceae bacterium]|nr:hypothetical protein [Acholeplasmataceae bacterium]
MDEYNSFDIEEKNENDSSALEYQEKFQSDLGNFTHLQDRLIKFGQSKLLLILTILFIAAFIASGIGVIIFMTTDLSFEINGQSANYNWTKIITLLSLGIGLILPMAVSYITYGSRKVKVDYIVRGLNLVDLFIKINYIILIISAFISFIGFILVMFRGFIIALLIGLLISFVYYLYFKFLSTAKAFLYDVTAAFYSESSSTFSFELTPEKAYPQAKPLRPFFIILLILSIISWLFSFGQNNDALAEISIDMANAFDRFDVFTSITLILNILILSLVIYMITLFDDFLFLGKKANHKTQPHGYLPKSDHEDDWSL